MQKSNVKYQTYVKILEEELVPAMGCTEPIAIAFGAAKARELLGGIPEEVTVAVSGNIIKNVKSVIVPNTNGLRGIEAAAAAGIVAGRPERFLEVIAQVSEEEQKGIVRYLENTPIHVKSVEDGPIFDIRVLLKAGDASVRLRIASFHTNIVYMEKNGEVLLDLPVEEGNSEGQADRSLLNVWDICDFAETVDLDDVREILERQISYNMAISEEGLAHDYGANIGSVLSKTFGRSDVVIRAKAAAAAGSDARMAGCELPVIINSGSGNQGITASVPVVVYAQELGVSQEKLLRALVISNLVTIQQRTGIGRLSAYCGAISAGAGAGAGIAYLSGGGYREIIHTVVNALAIVSGVVCDGAKPSCAAKIAVAVEAGILGYHMFQEGQQFYGGDGIVSKGVEATIQNVARLGRQGMAETDKEIIRMMIGE